MSVAFFEKAVIFTIYFLMEELAFILKFSDNLNHQWLENEHKNPYYWYYFYYCFGLMFSTYARNLSTKSWHDFQSYWGSNLNLTGFVCWQPVSGNECLDEWNTPNIGTKITICSILNGQHCVFTNNYYIKWY